MADVTINYGGQTIASLSDSGTEVLETSGTFLTDDITIDYVKSGGGGGGGTKTVTISIIPDYLIWVDGNGTALGGFYSFQSQPSKVCLSGSLIIFTYKVLEAITVSNAHSVFAIYHGAGANPKYTYVYQVD